MTPMLALLIFFAAFSVFGLISTILLTLRLRKLSRLIDLPEADVPSMAVDDSGAGFSAHLRHADWQARLQQVGQNRQMPEKYRFIRSLAERDVPTAEIAGILNLAPGEAEQLVALARVSSRQPAPAAKGSRNKKSRAISKAKDFPTSAETIVCSR